MNRTFTPEQMAQADRCDREKVRDFYPWQLYQDPPQKQAPQEREDQKGEPWTI